MNFSAAEENHLKAIYHLQIEGGTVTTSALAERLQTRPASVTDMTKKLSAKKLLHYQPYYGFTLTAEGKKTALHVIRRHRLWEYFLAEKLGFGWSEVHGLAEDLEHVSSTELIDRLDAFLGHPQADPHGDPIPDSKGRMHLKDSFLLHQLPAHQAAEIVQVKGQSPAVLQYLKEKGLRLGTKLHVRKLFPFDSSLEIKAGSKVITVTHELASSLLVKKI